jgi:hypothetical protein
MDTMYNRSQTAREIGNLSRNRVPILTCTRGKSFESGSSIDTPPKQRFGKTVKKSYYNNQSLRDGIANVSLMIWAIRPCLGESSEKQFTFFASEFRIYMISPKKGAQLLPN